MFAKYIQPWAGAILLLLLTANLSAQNQTDCNPLEGLPVASGEVLFNYGSTTNAFNFTNRSDNTIGQPLVGRAINQEFISEFGFWARFLVPPQPPVVLSSQGDFPDRVQITWSTDDLSSKPTEGYIIKRDGAFLSAVDGQTTQFIDFNVQAGEFYNYTVQGRNQFGTGSPGNSIGFVNPNGTVTGKIETFSGNPVANAIVTLEPTIGRSLEFDGLSDYLCLSYDESLPTDMWTVATWVKIGDDYDRGGIIDLGSDLNKNYWLHTTAAGDDKGIIAGIGDGTAPHEIEVTFDENPDDWHHVAMVYSGGQMIVYVDGMYRASMAAAIDTTAALFHIGSDRDQTNYFDGKLDDLRIYNKPLTQTDILLGRNITASSLTPGLVGYWKFDEGMGDRAFDVTNNEMHATIEGASFSNDMADVLNGGMTDVSGYYSIEGINYSEEQTFQAKAEKQFYQYASIEFNGAFESYADLSTFDLPDTVTVEISVQPFDLQSRQTLLSQGTAFELFIENGDFHLSLNGSTQTLGPANNEFQHLALLMNDGTGEVAYYRNGELVTTLGGFNVAADYGTANWQIAAKGGNTPTDFYTGLIDEVVFFDTLVSQAQLQIHASPLAGEDVVSGIDGGDGNLLVWFPLDEGQDTDIEDYGPMMTEMGAIHNATFSIIAYRQLTQPHDFRPSERVVNINPSATAIGNIDFTDESTVTVKGVIRFSNTFCYQDSVELLVNGSSNFPPIFTDSEGRFVGDFEPGANVMLTPKYHDSTHIYTPTFYEVRKLNRPVAGVLFQNTTKREIKGQIAGGECRLSINYPDAPVRIKAAALNGCYEQELTIAALDGKYKFEGLPPVPMAVSIIYHPDNTIYESFQLQGGSESDLRTMERDSIDFIYVAPPNIDLDSFPALANCAETRAFINQSTESNGYQEYDLDVRVYEEYKGERCYLDSFDISVDNDVWGVDPYEISVTDTTVYNLKFYAGLPNLGGDYTKFIQVVAETPTGTSTDIERVVVLGERSRESSFTSAAPSFPVIILRDPPGDGSSSTLTENSKVCFEMSSSFMAGINNEYTETLKIGKKQEAYVGTPFGGVISGGGVTNDVEFSTNVMQKVSTSASAELCTTAEIAYQTSDADDVVGEDADLFVGAALNFEFSTNDKLDYDYENCEFTFDITRRIWPAFFGTKYIYSRWQILTDVIPSLEAVGDNTSANNWRKILDYNDDLKADADFEENITFDALNTYTNTQSSSSSGSLNFEYEFEATAEMANTAGFDFMGAGATVKVGLTLSTGFSIGGGVSTENETTVSYTLADDDPNDNYTIDIRDDAVFGTPVFDVVSAETMCPWEPNTLNREQVVFNIDQLNAVNVTDNSPAVFNLQLTNDSQTGNDPLIYILGMVEGSNPDGAIVSVDGEGLVEPRPFQILPGETIEVLLTVERGPVEFNYSDIGIFMASECMWDHSRSLGYDLSDHTVAYDDNGDLIRQGWYNPADLAKFYNEKRISVQFVEPCTPIDISFPMQDWVVTPDDNEQLFITLFDYIYDDPDLDVVRVQYRPTGGDGSWINIVELPASAFANDPVFKIVEWDMSELQDGPYDIRAVSQCTDVSLDPGISRIIQGRKETNPPELFGIPEPADGVLSPGDEISITFTKRIRCDQIFQADGMPPNLNINNLALIDATTGLLIDATITCSEDKIIIVPNIQNQFIENRTLRVVTNGIQDFYGNETDVIQWEFFVNRSNLYWAGGAIDEMVIEGNSAMITRQIRNQGGAITSYNIPDVPSWMTVFPREGAMAPGDVQQVTFEFDADLLPEIYTTELIMETVDGDEPLDVAFRVTCEGPEWGFDPTQYTFSMNLAVELDIEGDISEDEVDRIAAFVDGELRGLANIEFNDEIDGAASVNPYLAFLTVYSNELAGEIVTFQIWDASDCLLYGSTLESFPFEPDGLIGSPLEPQTIHTDNQLLRKVYLHPGWNWISYNLDLPDHSTNAALASLTNPELGSLIKSQTQFSQYTPGPDLWLGSLTELNNLEMYQFQSTQYDSLVLVGQAIDPTIPIPVNAGWNWIGYLPVQGMPVTTALSSLDPLNGDIIKSQFAFAQYVAGVGWVGNLNFMSSPNGYLLNISNTGSLVYPDLDDPEDGETGKFPEPVLVEMDTLPAHWEMSPENYELTMNMIAVVEGPDAENLLEMGDEIGVFVNGELRGASQVLYVPELDAHLVFLTVYANQEGELLEFEFFDRSEEVELELIESFAFQANAVFGTVVTPEELHLLGSPSSVESNQVGTDYFRVYPNPSAGKVYLDFSAKAGEEIIVTVSDLTGRTIEQLKTVAVGNTNVLEWESASSLARGVYLIQLRKASGVVTTKIELAD